MELSFAFIDFDDVRKRLFESGFDAEVYVSILREYKAEDEVSILKKAYISQKRQTDKGELIEDAAKDLVKRKLDKFKDYEWYEIIGEKIAEIVATPKWFNIVFGHSADEADLYPFIRKYLKGEYKAGKVFLTHERKREAFPDLFALEKRKLRSPNLIAVDAKVNYSEYKRFLHQATRFMGYSDYVYLAITPGLVIEIGKREKGRAAYGENLLLDALKRSSIGLLIVDMTPKPPNVYEALKAKKSDLLKKDEKEKMIQRLELL